MLSLLEDHFHEAILYVYQVATVVGFGHLLIGGDFLAVFGDYMRFWYCFFYLIVALANILAVNVYFVALRGCVELSRIWSCAVTFISILISVFFLSQHSLMQSAVFPLALQISLLVSAFVMGISISILLFPEIARKLFRREREVK